MEDRSLGERARSFVNFLQEMHSKIFFRPQRVDLVRVFIAVGSGEAEGRKEEQSRTIYCLEEKVRNSRNSLFVGEC